MPTMPDTIARARRAAPLAALALLASLAACTQGRVDRADDESTTVLAAADPGAGAAAAGAAAVRPASDTATITVYKSPTCGCCKAWVDHLRDSGFRVVAIDTSDVDAVKRRHGVGAEHASCHTAIVSGYVLEGHVPAGDVKRLLAERPPVTGLAVPGMPQSAPGMDIGNQPYDVLAISRGGAASVFARH